MVVLDYFFLSLFFFRSGLLFVLGLSLFLFSMMFNLSWSGVFFLGDSFIYIMLLFMSLFILGVIFFSEGSRVLLMLSEVLVLVCMVFFVPISMFMLYIFFELSVFPILVMILGFGSQVEKISASYYLAFYTIFCASPFLFVFFSSEMCLSMVYFDFFLSWEFFFILTLCFMVKFPVFFLHLWLPKAHVEAPTTASMLLAGLLLKLGTGGFLRVVEIMKFFVFDFWFFLGLLGSLIGVFMCLFQSDAKALAAYSSITHMSFVLLSLVLIMKSSKLSGCLMMLSHGYTSTLMFYMVGEFYHKSGSRMMSYLSGFMVSNMMMFFFMTMIFLSNSGLPPSLSFFSEFMTMSVLFNLMEFIMLIMFVYFFFAFYYSIFILTAAAMGLSVNGYSFMMMGYIFPGLLWMFNFFWLGLIFA